MNIENNNPEYHEFTIDNSVCKRRFHLVYEKNSPNKNHVKIQCPHCDITLFEQNDFPQVYLTREENLIKSPVDSEHTLSECYFYNKMKG